MGLAIPGLKNHHVVRFLGHGDGCCALLGDTESGERESIVSVLDPRQNQRQCPRRHWHGHLVLGEITGAVPGNESWYRSEAALHQFKFPGQRRSYRHSPLLAEDQRVRLWSRHVPAVFPNRLQIEDRNLRLVPEEERQGHRLSGVLLLRDSI